MREERGRGKGRGYLPLLYLNLLVLSIHDWKILRSYVLARISNRRKGEREIRRKGKGRGRGRGRRREGEGRREMGKGKGKGRENGKGKGKGNTLAMALDSTKPTMEIRMASMSISRRRMGSQNLGTVGFINPPCTSPYSTINGFSLLNYKKKKSRVLDMTGLHLQQGKGKRDKERKG